MTEKSENVGLYHSSAVNKHAASPGCFGKLNMTVNFCENAVNRLIDVFFI